MLRRRDRTVRSLRVEHYSSAVNTPGDALAAAQDGDALLAAQANTTIQIFSSAVYCLRVLRRISRTVLSAGSFLLIDFCLIFVPFGHYDEPEILRYAITSIRPKGADVRQIS